MALPNPKELDAILKVMRKHGALQLQSESINLVLSEQAPMADKVKSLAEETMEELSPEEEIERLLFYSATSPTESKES